MVDLKITSDNSNVANAPVTTTTTTSSSNVSTSLSVTHSPILLRKSQSFSVNNSQKSSSDPASSDTSNPSLGGVDSDLNPPSRGISRRTTTISNTTAVAATASGTTPTVKIMDPVANPTGNTPQPPSQTMQTAKRPSALQRQQSFDVVAHQMAQAKKRDEEIEAIVQETFNSPNSIYKRYADSHPPSKDKGSKGNNEKAAKVSALNNQIFYSVPPKDLQKKVAECIWRNRQNGRREREALNELVKEERDRMWRNEAVAQSASRESKARIREKNERTVEALVHEMEAVIQGQPTALRAIKLEAILQDMSIVKNRDLLVNNNPAAPAVTIESKRQKQGRTIRMSRKDQTRLSALLPLE